MKSVKDPRHKKRQKIIKLLFAETYTHQPNLNITVKKIIEQKKKIDSLIEKAAPEWPLNKLNKIDLSILRLAIYELKKGEVPPKVVIDESIELAKEFSGENSPSFINGVLGTVLKELNIDIKKSITKI